MKFQMAVSKFVYRTSKQAYTQTAFLHFFFSNQKIWKTKSEQNAESACLYPLIVIYSQNNKHTAGVHSSSVATIDTSQLVAAAC